MPLTEQGLDAIEAAKREIDAAFAEYATGRHGIAQLIGTIWVSADRLRDAVFEGAGRPEWSSRVAELLEANNREVERRRVDRGGSCQA